MVICIFVISSSRGASKCHSSLIMSPQQCLVLVKLTSFLSSHLSNVAMNVVCRPYTGMPIQLMCLPIPRVAINLGVSFSTCLAISLSSHLSSVAMNMKYR